jgi:hypothetical protein
LGKLHFKVNSAIFLSVKRLDAGVILPDEALKLS